MSKIEYVASGCLAGLRCRYDGKAKPHPAIVRLYRLGRIVPLCPESLGGLKAPREACEWRDGHAVNESGVDLTEYFTRGATIALERALASGCRKAVLKSRSPSCGVGEIYDGTFSRILRPGYGIWAQKLREAGFELFTEENLPEDFKMFWL